MTEASPRKLRDAFGTFMTGVTVVTGFASDGQPIGFTANSFTSVSLDPPLLLISMAKSSRNYTAITQGVGFAVNILSEAQEAISNCFARPVEDRFAEVDWKAGPNGSPILADVAAWFDCSVHNVVDAGDHTLMIGRVEAFDNAGLNGLGYVRGNYIKPSLESEAIDTMAMDGGVRIGAVLEHDGQVLLEENSDGSIALPSILLNRAQRDGSHAQLLASAYSATLTVGFVYSVYEDGRHGMHNIIYLCNSVDGQHNKGKFVPVSEIPFDRVSDTASRDVLIRFAQEHSIGNYGIYFGNELSGDVRRLDLGQ